MGPVAGVILNYGYLNTVARGNGKMTVPVDPAHFLYATYQNIKGVPASEGMTGLSLFSLKIVDTIIENIRSARSAQSSQIDGRDAIRELVQKFHDIQKQRGPYAVPFPTGAILDLTA